MRPGPGLVVMALAFISGARRGSTNTSSKITQSPTAPPSPAPSSAASPLPPPPLPSSIVAAIHHRRAGGAGGGDDDDDARTTSSHHPHSPHEPHPTASILFPSFLGGGGLLTVPAAHPAAAGPYASLPLTPPPSLPTTPHRHPHQQQHPQHHPHQHRQPSPTPTTTTHQGGERTASAATAPDYDYGFAASAPQSAASGFGGFAFSFGGPPPALYVLPDHLPLTRGDLLASLDSHPQAGSPAAASSPTSRAARKRRALRRRRRRRRRRSATASAAADAEVGRRLDRAAGSGDFPPIDDIDNESDSASSGSGSGSRAAVDGLWVQFPSHSPDSSRSIDEDDILALVAEDDFLSEESFDRLTKLADETQKIADDLGEDDYSGGTESAGGSGGDGGGEGGGSGTDISIDGSGSGSGSSVDSASEQTTINGGGGGGEGDAEPERPQLDDSRSLDIEVIENIYAANLVSSGHNEVTAVAAKATASESRAASEEQRAAAAADARRSIFESLSPLTRLNPWISACDLAQPGTAPDLQGECSAGTLPVAWVDEGPGPPTCPISCGELRLHNKNNLNNNFNTNSNNNNNNNKFTTSNGNFKATKMRRDVNEKEQQQQHQEQHERDEQQKHDMKLTTTKTPAITIMKTTASAAGQVAVAATITTPPKATPASAAATTTTATTTKRPSDNDGDDDEDAGVMLMQQDDNGVQHTAAAVASATHHQSHDNNNIVKLRAGYRNGNGNSNNNNNNNNHHHDDNQNDNNYDWKFNEQPGERTSSGSGGSGSRTRHHADNGRQAPQQQCLHYLGDTEQTAPEHLCSMRSPSELVARLRTIRLRHCCERNVFTALHTVALNVTLGGGAPCVRILSDIMELDSLASRITCELAEILFRFDCRQVYSMINQCDDCKEAYRRWVCSTLVPYFAEPGDVTARPGNEPTRPKAEPAKKQREAASTPPPHRSPLAAANNSVAPTNSTAPFASSAATAARKQQEIKNLYTGNMSSNNKPQHAAFNYEHKRQKRYISGSSSQGESGSSSLPPSYYGIMNRPTQSTRKRRRRCPDGDTDNDYSDDEDEQGAEDEDGLQPEDGCRRQQSDNNNNNNFQTTANSEDPRNTDPVISKLLKRTKRKVEFRKRRRIRPCLSVCQTVERKCPYLLPADRAPALPTQYAGEPTFLCLDQNIPETGEQLRKSGHGPSECCYEFCDNLMDGLCTYCNEFAAYEEADASATANNNNTTSASGRLHNITMHPSEPQRFDTRLRLVNDTATNTRFASISIALRNDSDGADAATAMSRATLERLPYFAHYDGLYYYDDLSDDMPTEAVSEHCPQVPSVSTRCTIPYYATSSASSALLTWAGSSTAAAEAERRHLWHSQRLLIWLSALLCLLSSYNASQCRPAVGRRRRPNFCLHRENETEERGGRDVPQLAAGTVPGAIFHLQSNMSKPATIVALVLEVSGGRAVHGRVDFTRSARRLMRRRRREGGARVRHGERERERVRHGGRALERERVREYLQNSRCNDLINFSQIHFSCRSKWKSIYYRSRCNRNFSLSPRPRDSSHLTAYAVTINIITTTTTRTESKNNNNNKINSKNNNNMKIVNHNQNNSGKMKPPTPQSQPSSSIVTVTPKANSLHFVPCDWPHCRIAISNLTYRRYRYFYYLYNFNINDWWRRWGKRKVPPSAADTAQRTKRRLHPHKFSPLALMRQRTTWSL